MKSLTVLSGLLSLSLLAACGGAGQQADNTQPADNPNAPATASTEPAPSQTQTPQRQTPPRTAQQRPGSTTPSSSAELPPPPAPPKPAVRMVTVPAGTVLTLALDNGLSSKNAQAGDTFTATVVESIDVNGTVLIPEGAQVEGKVTEAVPAKRGAGNAKLALSFDVLKLQNGYRTNIVGSFQEKAQSQKKKNAAVIGGSAAGGALLGRILGKNTKGAVVGALVGGGVGTAVVMGKEGAQVKVPADTPFEIKLEEALQVPVSPERS